MERQYSEWFSWNRPNAGAISFVTFKGPMTSAELGKALATVGISMKPAYCFADEMDVDAMREIASYFRVGFGERKMPVALKALSAFVEANACAWKINMDKEVQELGE